MASGSVTSVRIAGVRVDVHFVRLLAQIVEDAGFDDTARALADAIKLHANEAPLTIDDHEAILEALGAHCPTGLTTLRRELLEEQMRRRLAGM